MTDKLFEFEVGYPCKKGIQTGVDAEDARRRFLERFGSDIPTDTVVSNGRELKNEDLKADKKWDFVGNGW